MPMDHQAMGSGSSWSPEVWSWSPELGRWSPKHGLPKQPVRFQLSTDAVPPEEAYDYWRDIAYYYFDADRYPRGGNRVFCARTVVVATPAGNMYTYRSDPVSGKRTQRDVRKDPGDSFDLGIVLSGWRFHRDETNAVYVANPGDFFCFDSTRVSRIEWSEHRGVHITVPRSFIAEFVGNIPPASDLVRMLSASNLTPFLRAHLYTLASTLDRLTVGERTTVFDRTVDLILAIMRQVLQSGRVGPSSGRSAYFVAAKQIIMKEMANPNLEPAFIARVLGCSRATLYRCFADHGWTVADYIREMRLREALRRLTTFGKAVSIASVASSCGFVSVSHFGRVFRARFGMNPKDVQMLASLQHLLHPSSDQ